jgi:hypothetical protein
MNVLSVILNLTVIDNILGHLVPKDIEPGRAPPRVAAAVGF